MMTNRYISFILAVALSISFSQTPMSAEQKIEEAGTVGSKETESVLATADENVLQDVTDVAEDRTGKNKEIIYLFTQTPSIVLNISNIVSTPILSLCHAISVSILVV